MEDVWTVRKLIGWTAAWFADKKIPSPRLDAEILLGHALGCSRLELYLAPDKPVDEREKALFKSMIRRRSRGEPVSYITGTKEFWSHSFTVSRDVLIPRPETEQVVETAIALIQDMDGSMIADLGTGSGCIAISIALAVESTHVLAVDLSENALDIARKNAERLNASDRIQFLQGSWYDPLKQIAEYASLDLIVSNPPYIKHDDRDTLQIEIRDFEPWQALDGGDRGLDHYLILSEGAAQWLKPGGCIVFEIGDDQADTVREILLNQSFHSIEVLQDPSGRDRVIKGILRKNNAGT